MKYFSLIFILVYASAFLSAGELRRFAFSEPHMATTWRVVLYAANEAAAKVAADAAFERVAKLDAMLSDFDDDSELSRLSDRAGGGPVKVSAELFEILERSVEISRQTAGAFDVTVGPVVNIWKRAQRRKEPPDVEDLARAQALVGIEHMLLDPLSRTVELKKKFMRLDLGGIAKGYAVDQALRVLKERGIHSALVAGGGDIGVSGPPPGEAGWKIDVQGLEKGARPTATVILKFCGISTSGDFEQHLENGGKRYSHIVDPKTGKALEGRSSVTVVAPDTTHSDALAKVGLLGVSAAIVAIDKLPGCAALFVLEAPDGIKAHPSKAWSELFEK